MYCRAVYVAPSRATRSVVPSPVDLVNINHKVSSIAHSVVLLFLRRVLHFIVCWVDTGR